MRRQRSTYNPFIVLSDVTISTLVVLACLLMIISHIVGHQRLMERQVEELARQIRDQQKGLLARAKKGWPAHLVVYNAQGLNSYLYRFPVDMFDRKRPNELSPTGVQALQTWARVFGPRLADLQGDQPGSLIEIQVRGHCARPLSAGGDRRKIDENADWLSMHRAVVAARVLQGTPGFPAHLVTMAAGSWHRRAYEPSKEAFDKKKTKKAVLEDRIDIVLIFAGNVKDHEYVPAWDGVAVHGPINDVADDVIRPDEVERARKEQSETPAQKGLGIP